MWRTIMATTTLRADSAQANYNLLPSALQAFLTIDDPRAIGLAIDALMIRLDEIGGDADLDANGDELDGTGGEDDFCDHGYNYAAGCPVSDPDASVDDSPCDACTEDGP
jgi:hypothetical protein